jgi:hypothetical protein
MQRKGEAVLLLIWIQWSQLPKQYVEQHFGTAHLESCTNIISVVLGPVFDLQVQKTNVDIRSDVQGPEASIYESGFLLKGETPVGKSWINVRDPTSIVMNWEVRHDIPDDLPSVPLWLSNDRQGIVASEARIEHYDAGLSIFINLCN